MGTHFPGLQASLTSKVSARQYRARADAGDGTGLALWLRRAANLCIASLALWVIATNAVERWRVARDEQAAARAAKAYVPMSDAYWLDQASRQPGWTRERALEAMEQQRQAKAYYDVDDRAPTVAADGVSAASPYVAAPFFSVDAFRRLTPGMTEAEVRDRLGYPLRRAMLGDEQVVWHYTLPVRDERPYSSFGVVFDTASGSVKQTFETTASFASAACNIWTLRIDENAARFDALMQLSHETLPPSGPAVLAMVPGTAEPNATVEALCQRLSKLGLEDVPVVPCVRHGNTALEREPHPYPHLVVRCGEGLFALPTPQQNSTGAACEADVDWALVRLLGGAKATKPAPDTAN